MAQVRLELVEDHGEPAVLAVLEHEAARHPQRLRLGAQLELRILDRQPAHARVPERRARELAARKAGGVGADGVDGEPRVEGLTYEVPMRISIVKPKFHQI